MVLERGRAGKMILSKMESDRVNKILQENNEIRESSNAIFNVNVDFFNQFEFQWKEEEILGKTTQARKTWRRRRKNVRFRLNSEQKYHLCCLSEHKDSGCYWKTVE